MNGLLDARARVHLRSPRSGAAACFTSSRLASALVASALCACASAPEAELALDAARASTKTAAREAALETHLAALDVERLQLALPPPEERARPEQPGFWFARAVAYAPSVRAALAEWRAAHAAVASAGAPEAVELELIDHDFGDGDPLVELMAVFDVLGHLGIGPPAAESEAGRAAERLALVQLERAAFEAWLAAERARAALAAGRARLALYDALAVDLELDLARIELLRANGRVGEAEALAATAAGEEIQRQRSLAREAVLDAQLTLALAAGLAEDHPALAAVAGSALSAFDALAAAMPRVPATDAELERHPRVRELRRRFDLAEADVRRAAALAWPMIGLGPQLSREDGLGVDDLRIGGVLTFSLPFPSRWRGALEAAVARRAGIITAFEDELLALELRAAEAHARAEEVRTRASGSSRALADAASEGWRATRALFRVGRAETRMWRDVLGMQLERAALPIDEAELLALATLDEIEARGPVASPYAAAGSKPAAGDAPSEVQP